MDDVDDTYQSEWNEQLFFSSIFFGITAQCRGAQSGNNILQWKNHLESKMSLVMGIIPDQKKEDMNTLVNRYNELNAIQNRINQLSGNPKSIGMKQQELGRMKQVLFFAEAEIDKIANRYMPFLRYKKKIDWSRF